MNSVTIPNYSMKRFLSCFYYVVFLVTSLRPVLSIKEKETNLSIVKPEYVLSEIQNSRTYHLRHSTNENAENLRKDEEPSYVFLQRFPLEGTPFFHTEVLVCPRAGFQNEDQNTLDKFVESITPTPPSHSLQTEEIYFVEIEESWWKLRSANCIELGYGSAPCRRQCCAVPHGKDQIEYPLNAQRSMIGNADTRHKSLFLYGVGSFSGNVAFEAVCGIGPDDDGKSDHKCWSKWSGFDYKLLKNNCNTFTSTVLSCVYGLSEKKPDLGVSDLVTVNCHCDHPDIQLLFEMDSDYTQLVSNM